MPFIFDSLTLIFACFFYFCFHISGVPPVDKATPADERYNMLCSNQLTGMLAQWGLELSPGVIDLLQGILRPEPLHRLTIEEILAHPWMQAED